MRRNPKPVFVVPLGTVEKLSGVDPKMQAGEFEIVVAGKDWIERESRILSVGWDVAKAASLLHPRDRNGGRNRVDALTLTPRVGRLALPIDQTLAVAGGFIRRYTLCTARRHRRRVLWLPLSRRGRVITAGILKY